MLSKVLTGRDAERARPLVFTAESVARFEPVEWRPAGRGTTAQRENHDLEEKVQRLEAELAGARQESFEAGRRQGEAEGVEQARAELHPVLERLHASLNELVGLRSEMRRRAENDLVQLALLIARRVLHRELAVDTGALTALARVVFERLARAESYQVVVHPRFASAVTAAVKGSQTSRVSIEPDPACAPGTLIVRSAEGVIDASVEAQLEEIGRGLTDRLTAS